MTEEHLHLVLDETQTLALEELQGKLSSFAERLEERYGRSRKGAATPLSYQQPKLSNVFGILGGRGAGKSTVLEQLYRDWLLTENRLEGTESSSKLYITRPLDCSVLPPDLSPGAAVLLWLKKVLKDRHEKDHLPRDTGARKDLREKLLENLVDLVGSYARTGKAYQDLCLELSSSPSDYGQYVTEGLNERFELSRKLRNWLEEARHELLDSRQAVVILLDDFDLVPAVEVRRWQRALLDELCQCRLIFVLSADYYRLEHLGWDARERFDDKTGRALVDKLLPVQNRVELPEWSLDARKGFIPHHIRIQQEGSKIGPTSEETKTLWQLVQSAIGDWPDLASLIATLLPRHPRGLVNLYEILDAPPRKNTDVQAQTPDITEFLSVLASCRSEPLLARRLKESKPTEWVLNLKFPDKDLAVEEWDGMIQAAREPGDGDGLLPPLVGLVPVTTWHDLGSIVDPYEQSNAAHPPTTGALQIFESLEGTTSQDPLRHERLHYQPLRDASPADQSLWAELLLDLGFHEFGDKPLQGPCRRRRLFLDTWQPAASRLQSARFDVQFDRVRLEAFFVDNATRISKATLYWLHRPSAQNPLVKIGWMPLMEGLRGARDPLSMDLLKELLIDPGSIADDSTHEADGSPSGLNSMTDPSNITCGSSDETEPRGWRLLPGNLRALLLLIDGLQRCPWAAFSAPLNWQVTTYLGLAAAFVRTSYVYALRQGGRPQDEQLSAEQRSLLNGLVARDPFYLLRLQEEEVTKRLIALFDDRFEEKLIDEHCVLSVATKAYLESPVYRSVVKLLKSQPQNQASKP